MVMKYNGVSKDVCKYGSDITTVLLVVFLVLKLSGLVSWGWIWVLSPLWIPFCCISIAAVLVASIKLRNQNMYRKNEKVAEIIKEIQDESIELEKNLENMYRRNNDK